MLFYKFVYLIVVVAFIWLIWFVRWWLDTLIVFELGVDVAGEGLELAHIISILNI